MKSCHHLLFPRKDFNAGYLKDLRTFWYLRFPGLDQAIHDKIHRKIMGVPAPEGSQAKEILTHLHTLDKYGAIKPTDPIELRLEVLASLCDCWLQPIADVLRCQKDIVSNSNAR